MIRCEGSGTGIVVSSSWRLECRGFGLQWRTDLRRIRNNGVRAGQRNLQCPDFPGAAGQEMLLIVATADTAFSELKIDL